VDKLITLNALALYGLALVGMLIHAVKKWTKNEIPSVVGWFITAPRSTVGAVIAAIGAVMTALLSNQLNGLQDGATIMAVIGFGYAADSSLNGAPAATGIGAAK